MSQRCEERGGGCPPLTQEKKEHSHISYFSRPYLPTTPDEKVEGYLKFLPPRFKQGEALGWGWY